MNKFMLIASSVMLLFIAGYAFYIAFKKYKKEDDFTGGIHTFALVEFIFGILLFLSEKFILKKYHLAIFKAFSLLFGIFMLSVTALLWILFI